MLIIFCSVTELAELADAAAVWRNTSSINSIRRDAVNSPTVCNWEVLDSILSFEEKELGTSQDAVEADRLVLRSPCRLDCRVVRGEIQELPLAPFCLAE